MTVTTLNSGTNDDGRGDTLQWMVDYDSVARTVGATITTTGTCSQAILVVTISATGAIYTLDCLNGPGGNITNKGRVILGGSGSVIGQNAPVVNLPVPPFGKGVAPPYEIDFNWHQ